MKRSHHTVFVLLLAAVTLLSGCAREGAENQEATTLPIGLKWTIAPNNHLVLGDIFTDNKGMTLYTYAKDGEGKSNCQGQCAVNWPPLAIDGNPIPPEDLPITLGVILREDGRRQVTLDGKPLYYYIEDKNPGDAKGQGNNNEWFAAEIPM
jgi:predicted lipoprotein with Yx(FWY)xxD motif